MRRAVQGVHAQLPIMHRSKGFLIYSAVYEGSHRYVTSPLQLLHGATLSRECCHTNLYRWGKELYFSQPVLSSQELTQSCMV